MNVSRLAPALPVLLVLGAACDESPVPTTGYDLSGMFPAATDHFWKYDNSGVGDVVYWLSAGTANPAGEDLTVLRWWFGPVEEITLDFAGESAAWSVDLYYIERSEGWFWMGWAANAAGPHAEWGERLFAGDGVPFAMKGVTRGRSWTADADGVEVTVTVDEEAEVLEFNAQRIDDAWRVTMDAEGLPFAGRFWMVRGPGVVQWDVPATATPQGTPWTHIHNDVQANLLGQDR